MKKFNILLLLFILSSFPLITSQEETGGQYSKQGAQYMDNGIIINTLVYDSIKYDQNLTIYMTPYEQSGKTLDNSSVNCRFGITTPDGSRLLLLSDDLGDFLHISENDIWVAEIDKNFFNETGKYLYNWDCQGTLRGGYFNGILEVTPTGIVISEGDSNISIGILYLYAFLSFIFLGLGLLLIRNDSVWVKYSGLFLMIIGFAFVYYDLHLSNLYASTIAYQSGAANTSLGIFVMMIRFLKLAPYIIGGIIAFASVKVLRTAIKRKKSSDGWDNGNY